MTSVRAGEFELLNFFGTEPARLDPDVPWPYNRFTYAVTQDRQALSFTFHPACHDVSVELRQDGVAVYALTAHGVEDVRLAAEKTGKVLEITVSPRDTLRLRLRPGIAIRQSAGEAG